MYVFSVQDPVDIFNGPVLVVFDDVDGPVIGTMLLVDAGPGALGALKNMCKIRNSKHDSLQWIVYDRFCTRRTLECRTCVSDEEVKRVLHTVCADGVVLSTMLLP